ncbi:uncharacterized protein BT62DRAFT_974993 [Guyanagaster necrorhizus]|uniref:Uncharacterized protein n=1 Tax=Guyanagaster necrorhizus TaxID=856835 RepID=A0A9P7VIK0_9AGAR|nr:uncharacterized protein BT62DRAFT_974993 [Guyanagaster necrorhizus MCA 3950]KAG7441272.1 hypothetical protein BT62DRAFT_974993 [Guyanagaster necrorhizus MCA 3950]
MFSPAAFAAFFTVLSGVTALPFSELVRSLPRNVSHIAVDEAKGHYLAFKRDGSLYGRYPVNADSNNFERRAASQCAQLSVAEAQTLSGWDAIVQYANDNWGDGSRNIVTNPSDYVSQPAQVCITDDVVQLSFSGNPVCQTQTTSTGGTLVGTSGQVQIAVSQGFTSDSSYTISSASTIGTSTTLSVQVGIPEVADVNAAFTVSADVTDTTSSTFDASYNDVNTVTLTINADEGKTCSAETSTKTCNTQATGNIRYLASGWVWFNYDSQTQGHYKWAVNIESVLTNQDDRSSFAEFKGSMVANTQTSYAGSCS